MTTEAEFQLYLDAVEGAVFEYKEARNRYDFEELVKYCVALANEGGGKIILGVTDRRPRTVVGTAAFAEPGRTESGLFDRLNHKISIEEYWHDGRRALIVHVPGRAAGRAWEYGGTFLMRAGDSLRGMSDAELQRIHREAAPDVTAEICEGALLQDLDASAIQLFRELWSRRRNNPPVMEMADVDLLNDAELMVGDRLTHAALLLFGTRKALGRHLAQAETGLTEGMTGRAIRTASSGSRFQRLTSL